MRKIALASLVLVPMLLAAADPAERRFAVSGFDAVTLSSSDRVIVAARTAASVVATGDPAAVALRGETRGNTLQSERSSGSWPVRGATVTVTLPRLRAVTLDGSGSIRATGPTGPLFAAEENGSGDVVVDELSAAEARLSLAVSGSITASGSAPQLWIDALGSGVVDTARVSAGDLGVGSSEFSSGRARASRHAMIDALGSMIDALGSGSVRGHGRLPRVEERQRIGPLQPTVIIGRARP